MNRFEIEGTKMTPSVVLDKVNGVFCIEGSSMPENPIQFYTPIVDWVKEYLKTPNSKTTFEFKIQYFNTSSSKIFLNLFELMESAATSGHEVFIKWYYSNDDEEMKEAGEELLELVSLPYGLIEME